MDNGKILYQGKPINKYYINNLDLLEGKYNLANSNLPHKEVVSVQVLENHQPIKMLDSLIYSDQAAINIKLKNEYTFTGQAIIGTGFRPLLLDANITPMVFTKKKQMISSYQTNNTGNNIATQLKTLTINDFIDKAEQNDTKQDWLGITKLSTPNFSEQLWLDNNIHVLTTNYLQKLKRDYELRINLSYINDYQQQQGYTNTQFLTSTDTIELFETSYNQLYTNNLETNLTIQKNTNRNFLKNQLQFQGFWDSQRGNVISNNSPLTQNLSNPYFKLSNHFKILFPLGNQIINFNSYLGLNNTPQTLQVNPGQFASTLNQSNPYDTVTLNLDLNAFYANNTFGFTKGWKQFSLNTKLGFQFEKQHLDSNITTASVTDKNTDFSNNLDFTRSKLYALVNTQFKSKAWHVVLKAPINIHTYKIADKTLHKGQDLNRITFEPNASLNYDFTSFWRLRSSVNLSNRFGGINQVYYNYTLKNYRTLERIDAPLPEMKTIGCTFQLTYRNPLKSVFFNFSYNKNNTENNLLYNTTITDNGATELEALEQNNMRTDESFNSRISKFIGRINTNTSFSTTCNIQKSQQVLNAEITDIKNTIWVFEGKIDTDITKYLNTELKSTWQVANNNIQEQNNKNIIQQFHLFSLNIYPTDHQYFGIKTEYIKNNLFSENAKNLFANLEYRYTWEAKNIDFEVQWHNVFNTKTYKTVSIDTYSYIETNFNLRPSQILFKVRFTL